MYVLRKYGLAGLALAVPVWMGAGEARAHGFTVPYDLPVPLWLYMTGAAATVALSFVVIAIFARGASEVRTYPRYDLLRWSIFRALGHPWSLSVVRVASVATFALIVAAGLFGAQNPFKNIAPILVWVIWWVGLAYVSALLGDLWALINPWKIAFAWGEGLFRRLSGRELTLGRPVPRWLGFWPAALLFLMFAWIEMAWQGGEVPRTLALAILAYSVLTWAGMFIYGREQWLRRGEAFTLVFGLLARFAPLEVRVLGSSACSGCSNESCRGGEGDCVNCYECYARAGGRDRQWNLRPYAVGLLSEGPAPFSLIVFVLLMLSTVTFDGFRETPLWADLLDALISGIPSRAVTAVAVITSVALAAAPTLFVIVYLGFGRMIGASARSGVADGGPTSLELAGYFVLTLIPIALAYHLAHYLSFLVIAGQLVIPLSSDPLGLGWNLFNTLHYRVDISIVNARFVWFTAVPAVVIGHIVAVYLAHVMAVRVYKDQRAARLSQYPMLVLMVCYTMISLWILAQPIVE
ncbi:MAG: hypothetical protein ACYSXF_10455, partial [Planctomycetota bacterium]